MFALLLLVERIDSLVDRADHGLDHIVAVRERKRGAARSSHFFFLVAKIVHDVEILERAIHAIEILHGVVLIGARDYAREDAIGGFATFQTSLEARYVRVAAIVRGLAVRDDQDEQLAFVVDELEIVAEHLIECAREWRVAARLLIISEYVQEIRCITNVTNL